MNILFPLFKQLVLAVKSCHDGGYIHGDLKLENIFVNNDKHKKIKNIILGDLGYCRGIKCDRKPIVYGSIHYSAPESFAKSKYILSDSYDRTKLDVWALGIILYTMSGKHRPYPARKSSKLKYDIVNSRIQFDSNWHPFITMLLRKMLQKNPRNRCNIDFLLDELKNIPDVISFD